MSGFMTSWVKIRLTMRFLENSQALRSALLGLCWCPSLHCFRLTFPSYKGQSAASK